MFGWNPLFPERSVCADLSPIQRAIESKSPIPLTINWFFLERWTPIKITWIKLDKTMK